MKPTIRCVEWFGDGEATLTVSDGQHVCKVFAHPFAGRVEDLIDEAIVCFDSGHLQCSDGAEPYVRALGGFAHEVVGWIEDVSGPTVRVGDLIFAPDCPLPGDIVAGQLVIFRASRLDYPL